MAILTIAVPTYNRNAVLASSLALLLPQLTGDCILTIIDNASDAPVAETLDVLQGFDRCTVTIIRNRVNIGANANVLRCLELCTTEWLWILGDDDPVKPGAVAEVFDCIRRHPEFLYVNFQSGLSALRSADIQGAGVLEFARALDSFSNAIFISTSIFNSSSLTNYIGFGYQYAYSYAPHLAIVLAALRDTGKWCLSRSEIVDVVTTKTTDQLWNPLMPTLGKMTLLELPMGQEARRILARKFSARPLPELMVLSLVQLAHRRNSSGEALFLYGQLCSRLYWSDRRLSSYLRHRLGILVILNWRITMWLMKFASKRLRGETWAHYKKILDKAGQDQWHRLL